MNKKMIGPVFFAVLSAAILAGYAAMLLIFPLPSIVKVLAGVAVIAAVSAIAVVLVQRCRDIKEEDKNDISKY